MSTILIALVVVGSISLAAAEPPPPEHSGRLSYSDKAPPKPTGGWIELASSTPATNGREYVVISSTAGPFTMLRIVADKGRPIVRSVLIENHDGSHRLVRIDEVLDHVKRPSASIDLHGAQTIDSIVIVTDRDSRGSYQVLGTTEAPGVATR